MRRLALAGCLLACAEWRLPPTFPEQAGGRPVIHEQAGIGPTDAGDLAAAQLVEAEGEEPRLALLAFRPRRRAHPDAPGSPAGAGGSDRPAALGRGGGSPARAPR